MDAKGNTVDFYLSRTRDKNAATAFFRKAMNEAPRRAAYHYA
ncbi:MAG: DDE-type integrase/transposase/recombinase [Acidobacteriota bacterium]|nr:DDE-type integrase/transposase/recombinase [Acidobacteriota bacterium]